MSVWRLGCGHPHTLHANFTRVRGTKAESAAGLQRSGVRRDDAPVAAAGLNPRGCGISAHVQGSGLAALDRKQGALLPLAAFTTAQTRRKDGAGGGGRGVPPFQREKRARLTAAPKGASAPGKASLPRVPATCAKGRQPVSLRLRGPRRPRRPSAWQPPGRGQRVPTPAGAEAARPPDSLPPPPRPAASVGARRPRAGSGAAGAHLLDVLPHLRAVVADHQQLQRVIHEAVLRGRGEPSVRDRLRGEAPGGPAAPPRPLPTPRVCLLGGRSAGGRGGGAAPAPAARRALRSPSSPPPGRRHGLGLRRAREPGPSPAAWDGRPPPRPRAPCPSSAGRARCGPREAGHRPPAPRPRPFRSAGSGRRRAARLPRAPRLRGARPVPSAARPHRPAGRAARAPRALTMVSAPARPSDPGGGARPGAPRCPSRSARAPSPRLPPPPACRPIRGRAAQGARRLRCRPARRRAFV